MMATVEPAPVELDAQKKNIMMCNLRAGNNCGFYAMHDVGPVECRCLLSIRQDGDSCVR